MTKRGVSCVLCVKVLSVMFESKTFILLKENVTTSDSPSSDGEAVVAVWVEAKERGHAVNTAQQHGQQPSL